MALLCQIQLLWMDYGLIVAYALLVLAIGFGFSRQQASSANFLLAGRSMGWVSVGISQLASLLSSHQLPGHPGRSLRIRPAVSPLQHLRLFCACPWRSTCFWTSSTG